MIEVKKSESTRYLCAAAYLDEKFRDKVLNEIVNEEFKAVGDPADVDIPTVVAHCLAAQQRERLRDALLTAAIPVFFILAIILGNKAGGTSYDYYSGAETQTFNTGLFLLIFVILLPLVAWGIIFADKLRVDFGIIVPNLLRGRFNPESATLTPEQSERLPKPQSKNLVVYSGYIPFIGAGTPVNSWTSAINVGQGKETLGMLATPQPFTVSELYNAIGNDISHLPLDGLNVLNVLFANGTAIREDRNLLAQINARPYTEIPPQVVAQYVETQTDLKRHYMRVRIISWGGELVYTLYFRCRKAEGKLFLEASHFVLPPVMASYRVIDTYERSVTFGRVRKLLGQSARRTIPMLFAAPGRLINIVFQTILRQRQHDEELRQINEVQTFDYGARSSIRQDATSAYYQQYFQKMDIAQYQRVIEKQLFETLIAFLESKGIDTSDLKDQRQAILNNGMIVTGGEVNAGNIAVGNQAQAGSANGAGGGAKGAAPKA